MRSRLRERPTHSKGVFLGNSPNESLRSTVRVWVTRHEAGSRVEDLLSAHWPQVDRLAVRRAIADEAISVNGRAAHAQQALADGDLVELDLDPQALLRRRTGDREREHPVVLFEDAALLVINKPAGLHTVPDRAGAHENLWSRLQELRPGADLRIVHRLDAGTSGCLALAKGVVVARAMDALFRGGRVHKEYLALVDGVVAHDFESRAALGPDRRRPGLVAVAAAGAKGARAAHTDVAVEERYSRQSLVRVVPRTGRSHQIRVHLSAAGHPIVGDPDYGGSGTLLLSEVKRGYKLRPGTRERPLLARIFLHAAVLELPSPTGGQARARSPLPRDLEAVLQKLRRFGRGRERPCV